MHFSLCEVARITRLCKSFNACVFAPINDWTEETSTFGAREEDFFVGCFLVADDIGLCLRDVVVSSSSSPSSSSMVVVVVVMVFVIFLGEATDVFPVFFVGEGCDSNEVDRPSGVPYSDSLPPRSSSPASSSSHRVISLSLSLSLSSLVSSETKKTCEDEQGETGDKDSWWCFFCCCVVVLVLLFRQKQRQERDEREDARERDMLKK